MGSSSKSVIIVGAGAASIQLAHTLWNESKNHSRQDDSRPFHVTIIEANDYVGGRVRNFVFEGHRVEMGANWVSGKETAFQNPIWQLAQQIHLQGHASDRENPNKILVLENGNDITMDYLQVAERFDQVYSNALNQVVKGETNISPATDQSVRSLLEDNGWTPQAQLDNVERAVEHNRLEVWVAENLEDLSSAYNMKAGANDVDLGQDEMFVEDSRGFNAIFGGLVKDIQSDGFATILLGHEVQSIHYAPDNVKVVAKDLSTGQTREYPGDIIVSTVSLGVLQSNIIHFEPSFPEWKMKALNELKMFNFGKVYAKFRRALWPEDKEYLVLVSKGEEKRGHYPFWMKYKNTSDNILMCYLGGAEARRVESLSLERIKDEIEAVFRKALGKDDEDCRPLSVAVTDWSKNPRTCGSYSYYPKGAFGTISRDDLQRGLNGSTGDDDPSHPTTLYFAGDAFDNKFNGWVQGGYLSGERTAHMILDEYRT